MLVVRLLAAVVAAASACTIIAVGKSASTTGSPLATHNADCGNCDFRIGKVPAMTHPNGSTRDITQFRLEYPRYVGDARGETFKLNNVDTTIYNWTTTPAIGSIPQVPKTFAYLTGLYGIMNEHQVSIGESTCGGRLVAAPVSDGGKALFDVSELTHVAMERATTAREAVLLMGHLAETYGYYGADWASPGAALEAGEALAVADPTEVWIVHFHPDDTGASAVWVAQRVPDGHVTAVANQFTIRHVNLSDSTNYLGSANMVDVAIRAKLYDPAVNGTFDFTRVYAQPIVPDQYYATRRVWRVMTLANPALNLSPYTDTFATSYPFSAPVANPLSPQDLMSYMRDHYEGTPFDMTQGPAAGPYGDPDRYDINGNGNMTKATAMTGHFERAISIFRTSFSFVSVANASAPRLGFVWFGQYGPHATSYVPIFTHVNQVPALYTRGSLHAYDPSASYWAFAVVGNWAARFYQYTHPFVAEVQRRLETAAQTAVGAVQCNVTATTDESTLRSYLTAQSEAMATTTHDAFLELFATLVTTFHDGFFMHNLTDATLSAQSLFYPQWWLEDVGYFDSLANDMPTFITSNEGASTMLFMGTFLLGSFLCLAVGFGLGMYRQRGYTRIN
ncbi:peptidase [Achlya hypogyna]|uniref:Peptidase n=1 Tax=Achlya hypogyna TaxID=1202772 RepID=A0A1V9ZRN5_ACHHY|nr:peptidase [Achlya hypogyna]